MEIPSEFNENAQAVGFSDSCCLFKACPKAAEMWDYEKNNASPKDVLPGSNDKYYWKCSNGHSFSRVANYFVYRSQECPECKKLKTRVSSRADLMKFWNFDKNAVNPKDVHVKSSELVWWKCQKCGYEWQATVRGRNGCKNRDKCPVCDSGMVVFAGVNDFRTLYPELAKAALDELNPDIDLSKEGAGSHKRINWKCHVCGYEWAAPIYGRIRREKEGWYIAACPVCAGNRRGKLLSEMYPVLVPLYSPKNEIKFDDIGSYTDKYKWECDKHGTFESSFGSMIRSMKIGTNGCPYCHGNKVKPEESFGALHPELLSEWDACNSVSPFEVTPYSKMLITWHCAKGHTWKAVIGLRSNGGGLCPVCYPFGANGKRFSERYPELKERYAPENTTAFEDHSLSDQTVAVWVCENGHHFQNTFEYINASGFNCPICSGRLVIHGVNDLKTLYPQIATMYDESRNELKSSEISPRSSDSSTWWVCEKGHHFQRTVAIHIRIGGKCPVCTGKIMQTGVNDLLTTYPQIKDIWDYSANDKRPEDIFNTNHDAWNFKCDKGHHYMATVDQLKNNNFKCLICTNIILDPESNSLQALNPQLTAEWADPGITANHVKITSSYPALWKCPKCGGIYKCPVKDRKVNDDSCPYCRNDELLRGFNDLMSTNPDLAEEWASDANGFGPEKVMRNYLDMAFWKCPKCHGVYRYPINERKVGDAFCPYCNKGKFLSGYNDLATTDPALAAEWADKRPVTQVRKEFAYNGRWRCPKCGGVYSFPINQRYVGDDSCPYCNKNRTLAGYNDLATTDPELAKEWADERPITKVNKDLTYRAKWKCPNCHGVYQYPVNARQVGDNSCPYCNKGTVLVGFNDLTTTDSELAKEWADERPVDTVMKSAVYIAHWKCPVCHGIYSAPVRDRQAGDDACPYCNGKRVLQGYNSFKVQHPNLMNEWCIAENMLIGVNPDNILSNCRETVWWKCPSCGRKYSMSVYDRVMREKRHFIACTYCRGRRETLTHY